MGKQVRYKFSYINDSETIVLNWEAKSPEKAEYRIYSVRDGKNELIGNTGETFFIMPAKDISTLYVETRTIAGGYLSESQKLDVPVNTEDRVNIEAIRSYSGVTLVWAEKSVCGVYRIFKKDGRQYVREKNTNIAIQSYESLRKRDTFRIAELDQKGNICRISGEFVYTEDCCKKIAPPAEIKISVIVPAYNNEIYLPLCIDSVLASSMDDIEVIIIDDGSTDRTGEIADWYAENYKDKVFVYHTENQGAAMARNEGMKRARGRYIAFADSDDFISGDMYSALYGCASENDCDIAVCRYDIISSPQLGVINILTDSNLPFEENKVYSIDELMKVTRAPGYPSVAIYNKIYKAELLKDRPIPKLSHEDAAWTPVLLSYANTFCYVNRSLYCYDRLVEAQKVTLSTEDVGVALKDIASERILSCRYITEHGNPEKREYLLAIALRFVLDQLFHPSKRVLDDEAAAIYVGLINEHKDEIKESSFIAKTNDLSERLAMAKKKYGADL